jgi:two-component system phosphate regulon sensor histidine kinase PhoR
VTPLISNRGHLIGYLQFEIPTKERDAAVRQYALVLAVIAPAILFGLGVCSLLVADRAMVPIQQTIDVLRQFISDAGHELNTPLSIINACHEALEHKLARRPQRSQEEPALKELKIIGDSSDRMQKIIDGLMLLAELENPLARPITLEILDIDQLLRQCTRDFQIKFEHEGRTLEYQSSGENPVLGDKQALSQLLSNLLENALRYTEPGGKVTVSLKRRDAGLQISVADDGIGIPQECLPRVFDRFYRVDKSRSRNSGGSGLGLSIVKAIAEAHRGTVKVESKTGVGTEFTLNLPLPTAGHND